MRRRKTRAGLIGRRRCIRLLVLDRERRLFHTDADGTRRRVEARLRGPAHLLLMEGLLRLREREGRGGRRGGVRRRGQPTGPDLRLDGLRMRGGERARCVVGRDGGLGLLHAGRGWGIHLQDNGRERKKKTISNPDAYTRAKYANYNEHTCCAPACGTYAVV